VLNRSAGDGVIAVIAMPLRLARAKADNVGKARDGRRAAVHGALRQSAPPDVPDRVDTLRREGLRWALDQIWLSADGPMSAQASDEPARVPSSPLRWPESVHAQDAANCTPQRPDPAGGHRDDDACPSSDKASSMTWSAVRGRWSEPPRPASISNNWWDGAAHSAGRRIIRRRIPPSDGRKL